jgi:sporulation protein YlmC with PRC-barrel domain
MSIQIDQALEWRGREVVGGDGRKIGTFDEIYLDEGTNEPAWAAVKTGPFRLRRRVVPIADAQADGDSVRVPFSKDQVKSAPTIDSEGWVTERDQATILRHYGLNSASRPSDAAPQPSETQRPPGADGDQTPANRVKLKRYTVTETMTRRSEFKPD